MEARAPVASDTGWPASVRVEEDLPLAEEIRQRFAVASGALPISVSDLLAPRRAFWRRIAPATPIAAERRERMEVGRSWHARLGGDLAAEGRFEVRVRRDGIVGRIDLLADVPVEVKTGAIVGADQMVALRPDHVEQIAMYCALSDRSTGRIVTLAPASDGTTAVGAVDLSVAEPGKVASAMRGRAEAIRGAVRAGRPEDLPACRWFGRRCEFQEAGICRCTGEEPPLPADILPQVVRLVHRPDIEDRWRRALREGATPAETPPVERFRDLIYPRRCFFERTAPTRPAEEAPSARPSPPGPDLYDRLIEAVEGGPVGEVARVPPVGAGPAEEVVGFRGAPFLVRSSRAWSRIRPDEAVGRFPQYALELAFRCAATGAAEGRVFLAFERAETERDRFEVLRFRFEPVARFAALWAERAERLAAALAAGTPATLPPCPGWMYSDCPYRPECACGPTPERSQR